MVHWKCKIYVIKIIFGNDNTFLLFPMRTVHLRLVVPFRLLFLLMSTIRCDRKNMTSKVALKVNFVVNFFNRPPPIQIRRMHLQ